MEQQEGTKDAPTGTTKLVNMKEPRVEPCELAYVTAINREESTFFAQQCKYSNQELIEFNQSIQKYCDQINGTQAKSSKPPSCVKEGDIFCTRYSFDNNWYRVFVKTFNPLKRQCEVYFIDYGNTEIVEYDALLEVDETSLPIMTRQPFGIVCSAQESKDLDDEGKRRFLSCLMEEYIMINTVKRINWHHWTVYLPRGAYNSAFWLHFEGKEKPAQQ